MPKRFVKLYLKLQDLPFHSKREFLLTQEGLVLQPPQRNVQGILFDQTFLTTPEESIIFMFRPHQTPDFASRHRRFFDKGIPNEKALDTCFLLFLFTNSAKVWDASVLSVQDACGGGQEAFQQSPPRSSALNMGCFQPRFEGSTLDHAATRRGSFLYRADSFTRLHDTETGLH